MFSDELLALSRKIGDKLSKQRTTITCAESCTGGLIAALLTEVSGSSAYFERGFVTYSNEAKQQLLNVTEQALLHYGAVSEQVVKEMVQGALSNANADYAISVSGIAGPGGGSIEKPVGTVWFGFVIKGKTAFAKKMQFTGSRASIRLQAVEFALKTINSEIL